MGLFWICTISGIVATKTVLIPDLMGLFWILAKLREAQEELDVLIPDLMGLFWIGIITDNTEGLISLNPRFDGAFLNFKVAEVIAESAKKS